MSTHEKVKAIIEGALLTAGKPLTLEKIASLFEDYERPEISSLRNLIEELQQEYQERSFELKKIATGYTFQVKTELSSWLSRLWEEPPPRYSRAFLETLAIIAYKQPITRADIEDVRGVAVNSAIIKTLLEHGWIRVVGHRDVPGHPELLATTKQFLDHFNLANLGELPNLSEIKEPDEALEQQVGQISLGFASEEAQQVGKVDEHTEKLLAEKVIESTEQADELSEEKITEKDQRAEVLSEQGETIDVAEQVDLQEAELAEPDEELTE